MKNKTKNIQTILFASLIAAMILPFSAMGIAEAQTEDSAYIKLVKQQKSVKDMSEEQRTKFIKQVQDDTNASSYDKQVYKLLEKLSKIKLQIDDAEEKGKDTTKLIQKSWRIIYDLEKYGVVSEERLLSDKDYWHERRDQAREQIEKNETVQVILNSDKSSNLYNIHTDDVSLKNQAEVDYLCFPWPFPYYCGEIDIEWGGGSDSHASKTLVFDGRVYMEGKICLVDNGGHANVIFTFDTEHNVYNAFNTHVFDEENGPSQHYLQTEGACVQYTESYGGTHAVAGSTAHTETHLDSTVTVTG